MRSHALFCLLLLALTGCATAPVSDTPRISHSVSRTSLTERVIEEIPGPRPEWIDRIPDSTPGALYFVGQSGSHALERDARNDALREAVNAFARYCGVDVSLVDEYLSVSVSKASGVNDPTIATKKAGVQTTEALVSRVKGQEWYARRLEWAQGGTILERDWQAWVLVTVPPDEVGRVQAYQEQRKLRAQEEQLAPFLERYTRAATLLGSAREIHNAGHALDALASYLDALDAYQQMASLGGFDDALPLLRARGHEMPLPIEAEIQTLLAGLKVEAVDPVRSMLPGDTLTEPLAARVTDRDKAIAGAPVLFAGGDREVHLNSSVAGVVSFRPEGASIWPVGNQVFHARLDHAALARAAGRFALPEPATFVIEVASLADNEARGYNATALNRLAERLAQGVSASTAVAGPRGIVKNFDYGDGRSGAIDYDEGFVEATAAGTADMRKVANDAQAEIVAKRTARHLAYEVLAETVGKIQIDSKTLYQDAVASVDAIKVETHAVIRGAQIVHDSVEWRESRRTKEPYPLATVTLRLFLRGQEGLGNLLDKYLPAQSPPPSGRPEGESASDPAGATASEATSQPPSAGSEMETAPGAPEGATAKAGLLIVDARGLATGYTPAFREYIRDESGDAVYGPETARPAIRAEGRRPLRYAGTLDEAKAIFPEAGQPLIVKAKESPTPGEITISADDARAVIQANRAEQFLREARVILVTE